MSAGGNPSEHAKVERFFQTLKQEEVELKEENACADAEQHLTPFLENGSNEKRLHARLGSVPPAAFDAASTPLAGR